MHKLKYEKASLGNQIANNMNYCGDLSDVVREFFEVTVV
jgi:hypothetical protein